MDQNKMEIILKHKQSTPEEKEAAYLEIQKVNINTKNYEKLKNDLINIKNMWDNITPSRIIKIVKLVFGMIPCDCDTLRNVVLILDDLITWAINENRNLLRLDLECKKIFVNIYLCKYNEALEDIKKTVKDLKKFDDKNNLICLYVYESKCYYKIKNFSRAKSSLTSARALAVSTYCSYELQAQIDLFNGMYLCDERNYATAFSYFLESLDGFNIDKKYEFACVSFRYLILSKIISNRHKEIDALCQNKNFSRYVSDSVVQMLFSINECVLDRNMRQFLDVMNCNKEVLEGDDFIKAHLTYLYDLLLEKNILKIIEVYKSVYIEFIAKELNFEMEETEKRIRNMILDGSISGIIDHNEMLLTLHAENTKEVNSVCISQIEKLKKICRADH